MTTENRKKAGRVWVYHFYKNPRVGRPPGGKYGRTWAAVFLPEGGQLFASKSSESSRLRSLITRRILVATAHYCDSDESLLISRKQGAALPVRVVPLPAVSSTKRGKAVAALLHR
jgi:hypothetical protein